MSLYASASGTKPDPTGRPASEDGYRLWLRYDRIPEEAQRQRYLAQIGALVVSGDSPTLAIARAELAQDLSGLLGVALPVEPEVTHGGALVAGTPRSSVWIAALGLGDRLAVVGDEGYLLGTAAHGGLACTYIAANTDVGVLYGAFHFLRLLQTRQPIHALALGTQPRIGLRVLNHWDNLDRTIERGYAGFSVWDWHKLPDYIDPRYRDYARACASIGLNGTLLNNTNASAHMLMEQYLVKVAAMVDLFRPYGLKVFISVRFSSPIELGALDTADPADPAVRAWWKAKVDEVYRHAPDLGGFVVKADSEGQPGPHDYHRTHAEGANMLADALADHGGVLMWRAFVYDHRSADDRHKQAYLEFTPLDGQFRPNVILQVKNGAIDFQPREPFHPLFGAMPRTPLAMEFQLTQEYLGCATHLAYLAPMYKECLDSDTYAHGPGSPVSGVIDGTLDGHTLTAMAAVANIGDDRNWCGHPFAQSNWYAFGRLCWDHTLTSEAIAEEWLRLTFSNDPRFVEAARGMMMASREAVVNYMTPLGLHHLMARGHHYGPGPWVADSWRADWNSVYYHRADAHGLGFDRTASGSNAVAQYHPPLSERFGSLDECPEEFLLWFHHVAWDHRLASGRTLWEELCHRYQVGVDAVRVMQRTWDTLEEFVDPARFEHVQALLRIQEKEARWWRDACVLYFQTFARRPVPAGYEPAEKTLAEYMALQHYFVPGTARPIAQPLE